MNTGGENGGENRNDWEDGLPEDAAAEGAPLEPTPFDELPAHDRLALGDEERLPWLESADDVDQEEPASGNGKLVGFGVLALLLLAGIVGAIYWLSHRSSAPAQADGSLIEASKEPYKVAPKDPGGKTFEGTGDSSFKVSEGERPAANLAGGSAPSAATSASAAASSAAMAATAAKAAAANPGAAAPVAAAPASGGVGVQVGAFSSNAAAEAAWSKLVGQHEALKGLSHRVVEGKADIGTVYRLQAVASDGGAANVLCGSLQSAGLKCQVKR